MSEDTSPEVVSTLEDDTGERIVDVLRQPEGHFTYAEYHRDEDDEDAWHEVVDADAKSYKTEFAAYTAATRNVEWLMD